MISNIADTKASPAPIIFVSTIGSPKKNTLPKNPHIAKIAVPKNHGWRKPGASIYDLISKKAIITSSPSLKAHGTKIPV